MATSSLGLAALQNLVVTVNNLNQAVQAYFASTKNLKNAANDAAAAAAGVPVGGHYRNGSIMMIRVS